MPPPGAQRTEVAVQSTTHGSDPHTVRSDTVHDDVVVAEEVRSGDGVPQAARLIALAAGAIVTVIGLFAVLKVDWAEAELDRPVYDVSGMSFTPIVAAITALLGLVLLAVAASRGSEGKIAMGAIVASLGAAMVLMGDLESRWQTTDAQGWLAIVIGVVFVAAGILSERRHVVRRQERVVRRDVG